MNLQEIFRIKALTKIIVFAILFSISGCSVIGAVVPKGTDNLPFVYALPFAGNARFGLSVVNYHNQLRLQQQSLESLIYFTFSTRKNHSVSAIRKGVVVKIDKQQTVGCIPDTSDWLQRCYSIIIKHPDGTFAQYTGFNKDSISVMPGQTVYPYSIIGQLTRKDISQLYQLRLMIYSKKKKTLSGNNYLNPCFLFEKRTWVAEYGVYKAVYSNYLRAKEMSGDERLKNGFTMAPHKDYPFLVKGRYNIVDTLYYDQNEQLVTSYEECHTYALKWTTRERPSVINTRVYYRSGQPKDEFMHTDSYPIEPGKCYYWSYWDNRTNKLWVMHGQRRMWYENGDLKRDLNYYYGIMSGRFVTYWDNGKMKRASVSGQSDFNSHICFDRNGRRVPLYKHALAGEFLCNNGNFSGYVDSCLVYPHLAIKNKIEGTIEAYISIDVNGDVKDVAISKSVYPLLDNEFRRVIMSMPRWRPWVFDEEPYSVCIPVKYTFRLPDAKYSRPTGNKNAGR